MLAWWWLIIVLIVGACIGAMVMGMLCSNDTKKK